jgi:DNA (cytosine-5)-methyltransferase 1
MPARDIPTVVSLFSGGGGLDLGLELAGFETRAAVEWEPYACRTLRQNAGEPLPTGARYLAGCDVIERSVRDVSGDELLASARLLSGEAALLAGGPPCVTFSVAGKREGLQAETGRLFEDYVRLLHAVQPAGLIFENVKGLINAVDENGERGGAFKRIYAALETAGYALTWRLVNAADYGVPQYRERVIILVPGTHPLRPARPPAARDNVAVARRTRRARRTPEGRPRRRGAYGPESRGAAPWGEDPEQFRGDATRKAKRRL